MRSIWIYPLNEPLTEAAQQSALSALTAFTDSWKAHGAPVPGHASIHYDRFIVIQAEPGHTSGCSIDDMNKHVGQITSAHDRQIMEANWVFFKDQDGDIQKIDFRELEPAIQDGRLSGDTTVFDNSLESVEQFDRWEKALKDTWMSRYLPLSKA